MLVFRCGGALCDAAQGAGDGRCLAAAARTGARRRLRQHRGAAQPVRRRPPAAVGRLRRQGAAMFLVLCTVCRELARHEAYHEVWACISDQNERAPMMHSRQPQDSVLPVNESAPAVSGSCY